MATIGLLTAQGRAKSIEASGNQGWKIYPIRFEVSDTEGTFDDARVGARTWEDSSTYAVGDQVVPTVLNGYYYQATIGGVSSGGEPVWPTTIGNTVVDGGVTWQCVGTSSGGIEETWFSALISSRVQGPPNTVEFVLTIPPGADPGNRNINEIYLFAADQNDEPFLLMVAQPDTTIVYRNDRTTTFRVALTLTNANVGNLFVFKYTQATEIAEHRTDPNAHQDIRDIAKFQFNLAENGDMAVDLNPAGFDLSSGDFGFGPAAWAGQLVATSKVGLLVRSESSQIRGSRSLKFQAVTTSGGATEVRFRYRMLSDDARHLTNRLWESSTDYVVGDVVAPTDLDPNLLFIAIESGTSDSATEPTWPTLQGQRVSDGDVTWEAILGRFSFSFDALHDIGSTVFAEISLKTPLSGVDNFDGGLNTFYTTGPTDHPLLDGVINSVELAAVAMPNLDAGLEIEVVIDTGAITNKNLEFSRFKLEPSSVVTPYAPLPSRIESVINQRHLLDYVLNYDLVVATQDQLDAGIGTVLISDLDNSNVADGDRILVLPGTHTMTGNVSLSKNNLTIQAVDLGDTIIDQAGTRSFTLSGQNCRLDMRFTNSFAGGIVLSGAGTIAVLAGSDLSHVTAGTTVVAMATGTNGGLHLGSGIVLPYTDPATITELLNLLGGVDIVGPVREGITILVGSSPNYTVLDTDILIINRRSVPVTVALPTVSSSMDRKLLFINDVNDDLILDPSGGEQIGGSSTHTLTSQYDSIEIRTEGTKWYITYTIGAASFSSLTVTGASQFDGTAEFNDVVGFNDDVTFATAVVLNGPLYSDATILTGSTATYSPAIGDQIIINRRSVEVTIGLDSISSSLGRHLTIINDTDGLLTKVTAESGETIKDQDGFDLIPGQDPLKLYCGDLEWKILSDRGLSLSHVFSTAPEIWSPIPDLTTPRMIRGTIDFNDALAGAIEVRYGTEFAKYQPAGGLASITNFSGSTGGDLDGVAFDLSGNLVISGGGFSRIFVHSGTSPVVTDSFAASTTSAIGIAINNSGNLIMADNSKVYIHSGMTTTLLTSFAVSNLTALGYNRAAGDLLGGNTQGIIIVFSGESATSRSSYNALAGSTIVGLGYDHVRSRLVVAFGTGLQKIVVYSGIQSAIIVDSFLHPENLPTDATIDSSSGDIWVGDLSALRRYTLSSYKTELFNFDQSFESKEFSIYSDHVEIRVYDGPIAIVSESHSFSLGTNAALAIQPNGSPVIYTPSGTRILLLRGYGTTSTNSFAGTLGTTGLTYDSSGNLIASIAASTDLIRKYSGNSNTILDSIATPATDVSGVAMYSGNLITCDQVTNKIYIHSGFSTTITDSFSASGTPVVGLGVDPITGDLYSMASYGTGNAAVIYHHSQRSSVILDSRLFAVPGTAAFCYDPISPGLWLSSGSDSYHLNERILGSINVSLEVLP